MTLKTILHLTVKNYENSSMQLGATVRQNWLIFGTQCVQAGCLSWTPTNSVTAVKNFCVQNLKTHNEIPNQFSVKFIFTSVKTKKKSALLQHTYSLV